MNKIIIVLMLFVTVFCYSQNKPDVTKKTVYTSTEHISVEQFEKLKETVNKLANNNAKLQSEKLV